MIANRVHRASFVKRMSKNGGTRMGSSAARKRAGKRLVAFNAARKRGLTKAGAMRAATRAVGGSKKKRSSTKRRLRPNLSRSMSRAQSAAYSAGYAKTFGKKKKRRKTKAKRRSKTAARRAAPKRRKTRRGTPEQVAARKAKRAAMSARKKARRAATSARKKEVSARKKARKAALRARQSTPEARRRRAKASRRARWPKQVRSTKARKRARVAYGPYRRARITDPRTGSRKYSYMTRKGGKLRRIPQWAVAGAMSAKDYKDSAEYTAARARIAKRRRAAAARLERAGDAFTPNAGARKVAKARKRKAKKGSRRKARRSKSTKRRTKRSRRASAAPKRRRRRRKAAAKTTTRRRRRRKVKAAAPKRRRRKAKRTTTKRRRRKSTKRRSTKRRSTAKRGKRRSTKRRSTRRIGKRRVRRLRKGLYMVANRRRRRRHKLSPNRRHRSRRHGRRYIRNGFKSDLGSLLKTGALILTGFFSHKALTGLALTHLLTSADGSKVLFMPAVNADGTPSFAAQWKKPITGLFVGLSELGLLSLVKGGKPEHKMAFGAGVVVSWLESLVTTGLAVANQPQALSFLQGYSNSAAYALRGARGRHHRGMRGLGAARNAGSIMPQYAPIGTFRQAAAGMGEYFKPASGVGEYFAGPGVQGVGHYEKAGSLALQPSRSHMGQLPVDDGIRPDANLDNIMDLAESAAGLGAGSGYTQAAAGMGQFRQAAAGMGEFFTASPGGGGFAESTVPTQSQWIPNGPLWAGSTPAEAAYTESELPAGILQGPGGNGVLSGG